MFKNKINNRVISAIVILCTFVCSMFMTADNIFASTKALNEGQEYHITSAMYPSKAINMYVWSSSDIRNWTPVTLYDSIPGDSAQRFTFTRNSAGDYLMIPTGTAYTVNVNTVNSGANVIAWENNPNNNEYLIIDDLGGGYCSIHMATNPDLYLTATSESTLSLSTWRAEKSQEFMINAVGVGYSSRDSAINWVNSLNGQGIDFDGVYGNQCVDLIKAYYNYLGVSPVYGNACDYAYNELPLGWQRIQNYYDFVPEPGDIAIWGPSSTSPYGHVAIVLSADMYNMTSMDQNYGSSYCKLTTHYNYYRNFYGVIRPNFG